MFHTCASGDWMHRSARPICTYGNMVGMAMATTNPHIGWSSNTMSFSPSNPSKVRSGVNDEVAGRADLPLPMAMPEARVSMMNLRGGGD